MFQETETGWRGWFNLYSDDSMSNRSAAPGSTQPEPGETHTHTHTHTHTCTHTHTHTHTQWIYGAFMALVLTSLKS